MFTFIESSIFERLRPSYLTDLEYATLQQYMMSRPEAGDVVRGTGGVRKLRWGAGGKGKRGGIRVIYYVRYRPNEFWMLSVYSKSQLDTLPDHILRQLMEAFRDG